MRGLEELEFVTPADIEHKSFEIIDDELASMDIKLEPPNELVVKRCIHSSADFDYASTLDFSPNATPIGVEALRTGCCVVTDTKMAASGINKRILGRFGGDVLNFISDADVAIEAKERGLTRSAVSMEHAVAREEPFIYALGNAPTALIRLYEMIMAGDMKVLPTLIIGVPVGFVNVIESKELICKLDVPHIVAHGRKGGSNIAACIVNALLYLASENERE